MFQTIPDEGPVIIGIDPGLAHMGWAAVRLSKQPEILAGGVIVTEPSSALQSMLASEDAVSRMRLLLREMESKVCLAAGFYGAGALAAESISYPRNASKKELELAVASKTLGGPKIAEGLRKGDREHFWDAAAVALAVADYEVVRLLKRRAA